MERFNISSVENIKFFRIKQKNRKFGVFSDNGNYYDGCNSKCYMKNNHVPAKLPMVLMTNNELSI